MLHADHLIELLDACGERGFHRCVDTCGYTNTDKLLEVAKRTDLFLYDLKVMDCEKHRQFTGVSNERILENLIKLAQTGANINIRIPFISGVNTDHENVEKTAEFVANLAGEKKQVNLLPYHEIATHKYKKMGKEYDSGHLKEPSEEELKEAQKIFANVGLQTIIGG
ncbi:MAG TPA: radical SAM protein, partial [Prolixibacteraceae bacterium]|nr:radical SAM protein [Prolixibacteraceae bacterium]